MVCLVGDSWGRFPAGAETVIELAPCKTVESKLAPSTKTMKGCGPLLRSNAMLESWILAGEVFIQSSSEVSKSTGSRELI